MQMVSIFTDDRISSPTLLPLYGKGIRLNSSVLTAFGNSIYVKKPLVLMRDRREVEKIQKRDTRKAEDRQRAAVVLLFLVQVLTAQPLSHLQMGLRIKSNWLVGARGGERLRIRFRWQKAFDNVSWLRSLHGA